jgi:hypothetical protein
MADDDKALVSELRGCDREIYLPVLGKAADRIEALSKENDRLNANLAVEAKFVDKLSAENERLRDKLIGIRAKIDDMENPFNGGGAPEMEHGFEVAVDDATNIVTAALEGMK